MYIICKLKKLFPNKDNSDFLKKEFIQQNVPTTLLIKNNNTKIKVSRNTSIMKSSLNTGQGTQYKNIIKPEYYPWYI